MPTWRAVEEELDRWGEAGLAATFWWRDDDAGPANPGLERLIGLRRSLDVALALAAVPAWLEPVAIDRIGRETGIAVLQHGWDHGDRAAPGEKKCEFPEGRPAAAALGDLRRGAGVLGAWFGTQALAVLVPPWNRIGTTLASRLGEAGVTGLSCFGPRTSARRGGVVLANTHVDPVDWHGGRGFVGEAAALAVTVGHLKARREGAADRREPTGLLTHHRVHDDAAWRFVERFIATGRRHPAVRWLDAGAAFAGTGP